MTDDQCHAVSATAIHEPDDSWVIVVSSCPHLQPEHVEHAAQLLIDALADVQRDAAAAVAAAIASRN